MLPRSPILLLLMCCFAPAASRSHSQAIRSYTVAHGLAHNHVNRIYRDSLGFLWICTDEGLSRFDGQHFVNYTVVDGLPHIHINDIIQTRAGGYWLATDGGLTLFDPAHPRQCLFTFRPDGPPQALFVNAVLEEPDGSVLVGTAAGLYRFHRGDGRASFERVEFPVSRSMLEAHSVNALYKTSDGVLWVGTARGLHCRDRAGTWRRFAQPEGLPHDFIERIVPDPEGHIWVCTRRGLARLTASPGPGQPIVSLTVTVANGLPANDVRAIVFGADGRRWIGTSGGLVEWVSSAATPTDFRVYSLADGLTDLEINALATGPNSSLWIGTRNGGLMSLDQARLQTFGAEDGLGIGGYSDLLELPSGAICVSASYDLSQGIRCFDGRAFRVIIPRLPADVAKGVPGQEHHAIIDQVARFRFRHPRTSRRQMELRGAIRCARPPYGARSAPASPSDF